MHKINSYTLKVATLAFATAILAFLALLAHVGLPHLVQEPPSRAGLAFIVRFIGLFS